MVPSKDRMNQLRSHYRALQKLSLDVNSYCQPLVDVAFELTSFDTFIAGIVDTLLQGKTVSQQHVAVLRRPLPVEGTLWQTQDGSRVDLSLHPDILTYAERLTEVRKIALDIATATQ